MQAIEAPPERRSVTGARVRPAPDQPDRGAGEPGLGRWQQVMGQRQAAPCAEQRAAAAAPGVGGGAGRG